MTAPKVGDVVAWSDVPDGTMVRVDTAVGPLTEVLYYRRLGERGCTVGGGGATTWASTDHGMLWEWTAQRDRMGGKGLVTIIALNLTGQETGQETAADLQRLAEVFEVREAMPRTPALARILHEEVEDLNTYECPVCAHDEDDAWRYIAKRLHALGWRKGQTAEDAARLLAEAGK